VGLVFLSFLSLWFLLALSYLSLFIHQSLISPTQDQERPLTGRCNITEDGKAALLRLSKGDMRRALNVLQVSSLLPLTALHIYLTGFLSMLPFFAGDPPRSISFDD
jgi:replication-associated recombination protein RarA